MSPEAAPLRLLGVRKTLADVDVLRDVGFGCPPGAITALLGPNGAGKTTSVAVATGLRRPDAGVAEVFGIPADQRAARARLSLVPQEIGLPAAVTVGACLAFVTRQREESPFAPAIEAASARLGVTALLDRRAGGLSGGQQRKVAVLLGLARAPGLLLLDEATTNLDEAARATTWELIREYAARGGSALVTSHILADIEAHADRLVALNRGRVVAEAPLGQLRERLGGSIVSVRVSAEQRSALADAIAARVCESRLAEPAAALPADAPLRWRTRTPMPLVAALAELAPDARDLQVLPIPLGELLQALAEVPVG